LKHIVIENAPQPPFYATLSENCVRKRILFIILKLL